MRTAPGDPRGPFAFPGGSYATRASHAGRMTDAAPWAAPDVWRARLGSEAAGFRGFPRVLAGFRAFPRVPASCRSPRARSPVSPPAAECSQPLPDGHGREAAQTPNGPGAIALQGRSRVTTRGVRAAFGQSVPESNAADRPSSSASSSMPLTASAISSAPPRSSSPTSSAVAPPTRPSCAYCSRR